MNNQTKSISSLLFSLCIVRWSSPFCQVQSSNSSTIYFIFTLQLFTDRILNLIQISFSSPSKTSLWKWKMRICLLSTSHRVNVFDRKGKWKMERTILWALIPLLWNNSFDDLLWISSPLMNRSKSCFSRFSTFFWIEYTIEVWFYS